MSESETQPSPARQRAEARKQKLLSQGNDRLAKITGAMKGHQTNPTHPNTLSHQISHTTADPPEIDISHLSSETNLKTKSTESVLNSNPSIFKSDQPSSFNPINSNQTDSILNEEKMLEMMNSMGLQLPPNLPLSSSSLHHSKSNLESLNDELHSNHRSDLVLTFFTLVFILGLVYFTNSQSQAFVNIQNSESIITSSNLDSNQIFWMFVTIEIGLQFIRSCFKNKSNQPNGILLHLSKSLPLPYSSLISMIFNQFQTIQSILNHFSILIFFLGLSLIYVDFRLHSDRSNWLEFLLP
ncbi:hypothetical protein DFH28DRAFT_1105623 [Melampsora americana]|nr:hypothetical protein DFH28DRAFT_1105623 [Melampsora americana]